MTMQGRDKETGEYASRLYDEWAHDRARRRGDFRVPDGPEDIDKVRRHNFEVQTLEPRRRALKQLEQAGDRLSTAEKVALLVMMELPAVDATALLQRLTDQVAKDPAAVYFGKENMADNCGCGCGCGCRALAELPYEERFVLHRQLKSFSIDPFNEVALDPTERDRLLISDFLNAYGSIAGQVHSQFGPQGLQAPGGTG